MEKGSTPALRVPILEVTDLFIARGNRVILDRISWRVNPGEHWVIMGPNGSGKTSLLHSLLAYFSPTSGNLSVLGETYGTSDWRELRKRVGVVSNAVPEMMPAGEIGLDIVASGRDARIGTLSATSEADRVKAEAVLKLVECTSLAKSPWRFLSQGERQRMLIGRAWMAEPALLILDEPCVGLDPVAREHFLAFLSRLATSPRAPSLVLVTHHIEEIIPAMSHVLLLRSGKIVAQGEKQRVLTTANLSQTFAAKVTLEQRGSRYALTVERENDRIC